MSTMEHIWYSPPLTTKSAEAFKCVYFPIPWEPSPVDAKMNADLDGPQLFDKLYFNVSPCGCKMLESQIIFEILYKGEKLPGHVITFFGYSNYRYALWPQFDAADPRDMTSVPVLVGKIINGSTFEAKAVACNSFKEFVNRKMIESRIYHHQFLFEGRNELNKIDREYIAHYEEAENKYFSENKDLSKVERFHNDFPSRFAKVKEKFQKVLERENRE